MMTQDTWRSDLLLVLVTLLAGLGWVFSREALLGMTPIFFIGVRFLCASLILAVPGYSGLLRLAGEAWRRALLTGAVMGVAMCLWILGLQHTENMGIGAFLTSLGVVLIPIVGKLLFGAHTARSTWVALIIALAGLACLRLEDGLSLSLSDICFLGAAVVFSLHFNLNSRFAARLPALPLTTIQLGVTGVLALLLSLFIEPLPTVLSGAVFGWLLASIVIGTCMRFFIQVKAQGMAPVSHAAVIMTLEPVWTSLFGILWFAETMTSIQLLGCGLIFGALLVSRWRMILRRPQAV